MFPTENGLSIGAGIGLGLGVTFIAGWFWGRRTDGRTPRPPFYDARILRPQDTHPSITPPEEPGLVLRALPDSPTPTMTDVVNPLESQKTGVMLEDTEAIEQALGAKFKQFFRPFRVVKVLEYADKARPSKVVDFNDRQDLLRYRQWTPPSIVCGRSKPEIIISPPAMDALLSRVIPMTDPRYYRVYKELSFSLCQRLADRMKDYLENMNGQYDDIPVFQIVFNERGQIISPKFQDRLGVWERDGQGLFSYETPLPRARKELATRTKEPTLRLL